MHILFCLLPLLFGTVQAADLNPRPVVLESAPDMRKDAQYQKLQSLKSKSTRNLSAEARALRPKAIAETGHRVGVQEGFVWRYKQILAMLEKRKHELDTVFDFAPLLLHGGTVMPPVITRADAFTEISDENKMTRVGSSYKILKPARFLSTEPSWRDYLLVPEGALRVEPIHTGILPQNSKESKIWQESIDEGWKRGAEHAEDMFDRGVNKLLVDLRGLIQYKILERDGYVSIPKIARGHYAIRVGSRDLEFDQEIFRITEESAFKDRKPEKKSRKKK